jgi:CRP-like cAMP-binding protein
MPGQRAGRPHLFLMVTQVAVGVHDPDVTPEEPRPGQVRGRWISAGSAERNLGLLRPGELAQLRLFGSVRYVQAGTVVDASGSRVTDVQVVSSGELELRARLDEGRATMAVVRTGGIIADIPLLLEAPMPFDAIASRPTELITLSRHRWTQLLTSSPDLALRWMSSIARRLDEDRRRLVVVTSKPLIGQVAYLLLDLAEDGPSGGLVVTLSHTTMAHLLGARRQSVTRVIGALRRRGLVESRYGHTLICDPGGLREVMGSQPLP